MVANPRPPEPARLNVVPKRAPPALGVLLREYRLQAGLSQNALARMAGIDPAYVNRVERDLERSGAPSRRVVLALWRALVRETAGTSQAIGPDHRERLLVAAGLVPEIVLRAGGWDGYTERIRRVMLNGLAAAVRAPLDAP